MAVLEFYFDVVSPNAYLSHKVLPKIQASTGVKVKYIPCLLGGVFKATNNQSPMAAYANIHHKMDYEMLEMHRFIAKHQITQFKTNPHFPLNTLMVMRAAIVSQQLGCFERYTELMFNAMWEQGEKLDDLAVIEKVLREGGLDASAILADIAAAEIKQQLIDNTEQAVERGVFGLPSFFVGDEMWFGKERLRDIEEYLLSKAAN
ncbi:MAG TPA: 2-hydroxychromene-2-carboxylate isomerase [Pseudomonadales bacterium]|nr:2-hydroxychromene-2-carboxylate isomerase [Pseudomonadales bacterium]